MHLNSYKEEEHYYDEEEYYYDNDKDKLGYREPPGCFNPRIIIFFLILNLIMLLMWYLTNLVIY